MRVGIDLAPLSYGNRTRGTGTYAENLVGALAACDTVNEYILLTVHGTQPYRLPLELPRNFSIAGLPAPRLGRAAALISHQIVLPLRASALHLDLLHALAVPFNPSMPGVSIWQRVPTIVTLFDVMPLRLGPSLLKHTRYRRFYNVQLAACRRAAHLITASEHTARDLIQYGIAPRSKITVIPLAPSPLAVDGAVSPKIQALVNGGPFLLHVGGSEPQKNQELVLRAFGLLCRNPAFRHTLVLVGARHHDDEVALALSTRAALRILRVPVATRAELDTLYAHCDAFLMPSWYEGFGLPVLEAMRAGAPVVISNQASLPEVTGEAALVVDPGDAPALASAIRRILDDERLRIKLSEGGARRAAQFTWARTAELTRQVYARVAQGGASTPMHT